MLHANKAPHLKARLLWVICLSVRGREHTSEVWSSSEESLEVKKAGIAPELSGYGGQADVEWQQMSGPGVATIGHSR